MKQELKSLCLQKDAEGKFEDGDIEGAIESFNGVYTLSVEKNIKINFNILFNIAICYAKKEAFKKARLYFKEALKMDSISAISLYFMGVTFYQEGLYQLGLQHFTYAIQAIERRTSHPYSVPKQQQEPLEISHIDYKNLGLDIILTSQNCRYAAFKCMKNVIRPLIKDQDHTENFSWKNLDKFVFSNSTEFHDFDIFKMRPMNKLGLHQRNYVQKSTVIWQKTEFEEKIYKPKSRFHKILKKSVFKKFYKTPL